VLYYMISRMAEGDSFVCAIYRQKIYVKMLDKH